MRRKITLTGVVAVLMLSGCLFTPWRFRVSPTSLSFEHQPAAAAVTNAPGHTKP